MKLEVNSPRSLHFFLSKVIIFTEKKSCRLKIFFPLVAPSFSFIMQYGTRFVDRSFNLICICNYVTVYYDLFLLNLSVIFSVVIFWKSYGSRRKFALGDLNARPSHQGTVKLSWKIRSSFSFKCFLGRVVYFGDMWRHIFVPKTSN